MQFNKRKGLVSETARGRPHQSPLPTTKTTYRDRTASQALETPPGVGLGSGRASLGGWGLGFVGGVGGGRRVLVRLGAFIPVYAVVVRGGG